MREKVYFVGVDGEGFVGYSPAPWDDGSVLSFFTSPNQFVRVDLSDANSSDGSGAFLARFTLATSPDGRSLLAGVRPIV